MAQVDQDLKFGVSLHACEDGDCLKIEFSGDQKVVMFLSPAQARAFASELIQTVYRAEVKNSLQKKQPASVPAASKAEPAAGHYGTHPRAA